jgi:hypothetical protein
VVASAALPLTAGQTLTLAAVGRLGDVSLLPLQDDNSPPAEGKVKVRFVHAVPDAPTVDIAVQGGTVLFPRVGFQSVAGYVEVDPGVYSLDVRPTGSEVVAFSVPNLSLQAGQVVTVFASGLAAANSVRAIPVWYTDVGEGSLPSVMARAGAGRALRAHSNGALGQWGIPVALVLLVAVAMRLGSRPSRA